MLPSYFEHIMKYSKTSLLCRMLGLFRLRYGGVDTFFLLMMNISRQDVSCRRIVTSFDLKGSLRSRRVRAGEKCSVMKDINWVRFFGKVFTHLHRKSVTSNYAWTYRLSKKCVSTFRRFAPRWSWNSCSEMLAIWKSAVSWITPCLWLFTTMTIDLFWSVRVVLPEDVSVFVQRVI